ncbi:MAG: hypothetical protein MJ214_01620 [Bacilli bacterium]|nr:hypothetical protein [Bacilli bacterium]
MKGKILLLAIPLLFSCSNNEEHEKDPVIPHHSYEEVSDKMVNWLDVFTHDEDYCVYFFSRTCQYCDSIRDEVIEIALTHLTPIYFCNDNTIVTDRYLDVESTIGQGDISEFRIKGFPSIIEVDNHLVKTHCPGKSATLNFIRSIA